MGGGGGGGCMSFRAGIGIGGGWSIRLGFGMMLCVGLELGCRGSTGGVVCFPDDWVALGRLDGVGFTDGG
jgi:hypothetical protein